MLVDLGRNDLSRVCRPGTVRVAAVPRAGALLARRRTSSRRSWARSSPAATAFDLLRATFPAGTVSGAPKVRAMQIISELEGYGRGTYAGVVGYALPGRRPRHVHRDPHARARATASPTCRRAAASSPTPTPPPSTRSAWTSWRRSRRRSTSRRRRDDPAARQLRLVHLQPRRTCSRSSAPRWSCGGTTRSTPTRPSRSARRTSSSRPGPGRPEQSGATLDVIRRLAPTTPTLGVCLGHQAVVEAFGGEIGPAARLLHGKTSQIHHDGEGHLRRAAAGLHRRPLPLAGRGPRARVPDRLGAERRRRGHGRPPQGAAGRRRAVPPRVGARRFPLGRDLLRNFLER